MHSNDPGHHGQHRLNFDVLRLICNDLTEVSDVLSFALTCSTLRKGALQRRLRMSPVVLSRPDSVDRFHSFIFADPTSRAPYLYGLELSPHCDYAPNDDPRFKNCLVAILEAATNLQYLYFPTIIGHPVSTVVAKMTTLRELTVFSDSASHTQHEPEALDSLLTALRSPLQYLSIANYEPGQISAGFLHNHLRHFAPTLESLRLEDFHFNISPSSVTTPFTAMRSLRIDPSYQLHFYRLDVLLRLFPNLDDTLFMKVSLTPRVDRYPALREQSKEAQKDHTWSGLDRVVYNAVTAFLLALRCPIRCMDIAWPVLDDTPYLAETLRHNCPRQLLLPIVFFGHDHLQHLDGLFPPEAADRLTHLVLFAEMDVNRCRPLTGQCNNFSWDQFMDSLVGSMKHLRLTHLRIIFYYHVFQPVSTSEPTQPNAASDADEDFAQNIAHETDLHPAAIRLLDIMPTLQYVFLTTCGVRRYGQPWKYWHASKAWRVVGADSDEDPRPSDTKRGSCVEIGDEVAEAVVGEEELHLGHREENMVRHCVESAST